MCPPPFVGADKTEGGSVSASIPHPFFLHMEARSQDVICYGALDVSVVWPDHMKPADYVLQLSIHVAEMMSFEIKGLIAERGFSRLPALIAIDSITDSASSSVPSAHSPRPWISQSVKNRMHNSLFHILLY